MIHIQINPDDLAQIDNFAEQFKALAGVPTTRENILRHLVCAGKFEIKDDATTGDYIVDLDTGAVEIADVMKAAGFDAHKLREKIDMSRQAGSGPKADDWVNNEIEAHNRTMN